MKQTKRILSLLLAVFMIAATFVVPAFADAEADVAPTGDDAQSGTSGSTSHVEGLELSKVYDEQTKQLTLEAYVTGESQTVLVTEPADIALVLDVSGSMEKSLSKANLENWILDAEVWRKNDSLVKVADRTDVSDLDTIYGAAEGVYLLQSTPLGGLVKMKYEGGQWWYYGAGKEWKTIDKSSWGDGDVYISKLNALKIAVKRFIDETNEVAPESKIAIIKFAGDSTDVIGNDTYKEGGVLGYGASTYNYSQIVIGLTTVSGNADSLKSAVDSLVACGATRADYGMAHAQTALAGSDRQTVVAMFTDGEPTSESSFEKSVANSAIATSKTLKDNGTLVFSVGCWSSVPDSDTDKYMNYVSSNYPGATDLDTPGTANEHQRYYMTAATSSELTEVFKTISQETGGAATSHLTETTVIKDIIGEHFTIPADGKVTVEVWNCTGFDNGEYKWSKTDEVITPEVDGKTVTVKGFDFSANWVGNHSGTYSGKKLVIIIDIDVDPQSDAYGKTETNAAGSGVYLDGKMLEAFPRPTCDIPYFTIKHTSGAADEFVQLHKLTNGKVNFTEHVADGYLYGGTFTSSTFNAETALGGDPTKCEAAEGAVYYLREVSENYLVPKNTIVWDNNGALNAFYLLSTVDSYELYNAVGFEINGNANEVETVYELVQVTKLKNQVAVHNGWIYTENGTIKSSNATETPAKHDSYIMLKKVELDADVPTVFTPYWVTLDGVVVYGNNTRTCTYDPTKSQRNLVTSADAASSKTPEFQSAEPAPVMLRAAVYFTLGADNDITVTVVDGETYELNVQPGDISASITYKGAEGKVFAGWYLDKEFTTPADLANVNKNTTLYARYVDAGYLKVKYTEQRLFRVYGVTFASAIVDTDLNETGFIVNGERVTANVYTTRFALMNARTLFGNGVERGAYMMTGSYYFRNAADGDELTITPYWVTADGTFVTGESRTLVWHPYWVEG